MLGNLIGGDACLRGFNALWFGEELFAQLFNWWRHGRRKQHGLAVIGQGADNLFDRLKKAQIKHMIGFVQH